MPWNLALKLSRLISFATILSEKKGNAKKLREWKFKCGLEIFLRSKLLNSANGLKHIFFYFPNLPKRAA